MYLYDPPPPPILLTAVNNSHEQAAARQAGHETPVFESAAAHTEKAAPVSLSAPFAISLCVVNVYIYIYLPVRRTCVYVYAYKNEHVFQSDVGKKKTRTVRFKNRRHTQTHTRSSVR